MSTTLPTKRSRNALIADLAAADANVKAALTGPLQMATKQDTQAGQTAVQPSDLQEALADLIVDSLGGDINFAATVNAKIDAKANKIEVEQALNQKATSIQGAKADTAVQPSVLAQALANLIATTLLGDPQFGQSVYNLLNSKAAISTLSNLAFSGSASDVAETQDRRFVAASDKTKLNYLSITKNTDIDSLVERVQSLSGGFSVRGEWDASTGLFPQSSDFGPIFAGNVFIVTTGGTVDSEEFDAGDRLLALIDSPSASSYGQNWFKEDYTAEVSSVAGRVGNVVLEVDDLVDSTVQGQNIVKAATPADVRGLIQAQQADPLLTSISGVGISQDKLLYGTGTDQVGMTDLTSLGRTLLASGTTSAFKTNLELHAVATSGSWNDLLDKPDYTTTFYTKAQVDSAFGTVLRLTGGTLSGGLGLEIASDYATIAVRAQNTGNVGFAAMRFAANGRAFDSSGVHAEFGQRWTGNPYIWSKGQEWTFRQSDGSIIMPAGGRIDGAGNIYMNYDGWRDSALTTIISRKGNVRLGGAGWLDLRSTGGIYDYQFYGGNVVTGLTTNNAGGDNRSVVAMFYRGIQQTDHYGNWYNVGSS